MHTSTLELPSEQLELTSGEFQFAVCECVCVVRMSGIYSRLFLIKFRQNCERSALRRQHSGGPDADTIPVMCKAGMCDAKQAQVLSHPSHAQGRHVQCKASPGALSSQSCARPACATHSRPRCSLVRALPLIS